MKLLKAADRTVSVLGLVLFGVLTGFSLFTTVYFKTTYEEIPYQTGDILPLVLAVCALAVWLMYQVSGWILKKEEGQEKRIRILFEKSDSGRPLSAAAFSGSPPGWRRALRRGSIAGPFHRWPGRRACRLLYDIPTSTILAYS